MSDLLPPKEPKRGPEPMEPITVRLPVALIDKLEAIEKATGYKLSEIVRRFLDSATEQHLEQEKATKKTRK